MPIICEKWNGHRGPISCLDSSEEEVVMMMEEGDGGCSSSSSSSSSGRTSHRSLLLSGSEDKTARLWDLRENSIGGSSTSSSNPRRRASLCISAPGEIFNVKFAPKIPKRNHPQEEASTALSSPFAKDHSIYISMERIVLEYDLRMATGPILSSPIRDLSMILQNQDEVNQIAVTYSSSSSSDVCHYIATADDAGTVRVMESTSTQSQILHHDPNGVAVVPCCAFRPFGGDINYHHQQQQQHMVNRSNAKKKKQKKSTLELVSGGTDCKIHLWDVFKPKRPISTFTIQPNAGVDANSDGSTSRPQICNPPMVHSLAWSPSGRLLAAGLGDGTIPIFSIDNRTLVQTASLSDGHLSSVAFVLFPTFAQGNERLVISGGSDGSILGWDLGTNVFELADTNDPNELFDKDDDDFWQSTTTNMVEDVTRQTNSLSLMTGKPKIVFQISHSSKINWMTTSGNSIFVADTTHSITEYQLPLDDG